MHSLTKTFFCGVTLALAWRLLPMPWHTNTRYTAKAAPNLAVMALPQVDLDTPTAAYGVDTAHKLYLAFDDQRSTNDHIAMRLYSLIGAALMNDTYVADTSGFSGNRALYPRLLDDELCSSFSEEINPNVW